MQQGMTEEQICGIYRDTIDALYGWVMEGAMEKLQIAGRLEMLGRRPLTAGSAESRSTCLEAVCVCGADGYVILPLAPTSSRA